MKFEASRGSGLPRNPPTAASAFILMVIMVIVALGLAFSAAAQSSKKEKPTFTYQRVVPTGIATYRHEKTCIAFAGFLASGNFFDGLRPDDTISGRKFFRGPDEVKEFPPEVTLEIQTMMLDCSRFPAEPLHRAAADPLLRSLTFKLNWKRGLEQRPVEDFSLQVYEPKSGSWAENGSLDWAYDLTVRSTSVPLTDSLITEIYSKSKLLIRLSAHL
jgi:hypothetical protein